MTILLTLVQIIVCIFLILVVLLQTGKGGDLASTFGGASSQTVFGARGAATILNKLTVVAAVFFILNSLALAVISTKSGPSSVMEKVQEVQAEGMSPSDIPDTDETPVATDGTAPAPEEDTAATEAVEGGVQEQVPEPAEEATE